MTVRVKECTTARLSRPPSLGTNVRPTTASMHQEKPLQTWLISHYRYSVCRASLHRGSLCHSTSARHAENRRSDFQPDAKIMEGGNSRFPRFHQGRVGSRGCALIFCHQHSPTPIHRIIWMNKSVDALWASGGHGQALRPQRLPSSQQ